MLPGAKFLDVELQLVLPLNQSVDYAISWMTAKPAIKYLLYKKPVYNPPVKQNEI